ncbi:uncharacterized protein LOC125946874 isoform X2 [Dermacentor silvarum]|uniref:uncharacterized protein LOC125946874 isoform X2 n=1 Tax=Dermacentor silvarum TaxID=543639 RepID=UPI0021006D8B|nr:uncharacterized protein LOC125946874 isoform X2 [Dermacentor silvarum]
MAHLVLPVVLLLTGLLDAAMSDIVVRKPDDRYNIKTFLGTEEPIWTYNSTIHANITCKVDRMVNMTEEAINFNRTMYFHGNKSGYPVEGTFFSEEASEPYAILFGAPGGLKEGYELIIYANDNYTCAVMNVTLTLGLPTFWFDLRVVNSSVDIGPDKGCQNYFKSVAPKSDQLYKPECQTILEHSDVTPVRLRDILN